MHTKSCGCLKLALATTHGESHSRIYRIWKDVKVLKSREKEINPGEKQFTRINKKLDTVRYLLARIPNKTFDIQTVRLSSTEGFEKDYYINSIKLNSDLKTVSVNTNKDNINILNLDVNNNDLIKFLDTIIIKLEETTKGQRSTLNQETKNKEKLKQLTKKAIEDFSYEVRNASSYDRIDSIEQDGSGWSFSIRYWGNWVTNDYEEDYDWERLSSGSAAKMDKIVDRINKRYPGVSAGYSVGEKHWLTCYVEEKR